MNTEYPDHETYRTLYRRFYETRPVEDLILRAGSLEGRVIMDLCAGDARLTLVALQKGAENAIVIEQQASMIPSGVWAHPRIRICLGTIKEQLGRLKSGLPQIDVVFCQQAVNYWLDAATASLVASVLRPDGVFVFNTFNTPPPEVPYVKTYDMGGVAFVEVSWLIGDAVHHVQIRQGMEPHYTQFQWISPKKFQELLSPHFEITVTNAGHSALYCCKKK